MIQESTSPQPLPATSPKLRIAAGCWPELACETAVPPKWPPSLGDAVGSTLSQDEPNPWKAASGSCPVNVTQPQGPRATDTLTGGCAGPHAPTFGQRLQRGGASALGAAQRPEVGPWASGKLPSGHSRRGVMGTGGQCGRPWLWPSLLWGCGGHFASPGPQSAPPSCSSWSCGSQAQGLTRRPALEQEGT